MATRYTLTVNQPPRSAKNPQPIEGAKFTLASEDKVTDSRHIGLPLKA